MSRPADWAPLHEGDPVPGDVAAVRAEGTRLSRTAVEIEDQVAVLRRIAAGEGLSGDYVSTLHDGATDSADRLSRLTNRYREVGATLTTYAPQLEVAQEQSVTLLRRAQEAQARAEANARAAANTVIPESAADDADEATKTKTKTAIEDAEGARRRLQQEADTASADVEAERARLRDVMAQRDAAAERAAAAIRRAVDDSVTDSWWDNYKEWVHDNAGWLSTAATVAGYIGAALAIVGVVIVAGVPAAIIGAVGLVVALGALTMHALLASAGEGSWADVGLDVFSLVTFGAGRVAGTGLKIGRLTIITGRAERALAGVQGVARDSEAAAKGVVQAGKVWKARVGSRVIEGTASAVKQQLGRLASRGGASARPAAKALATLRAQERSLTLAAARRGRAAMSAVDDFFESKVTTSVIERIRVGGLDAELAEFSKRVALAAEKYPETAGSQARAYAQDVVRVARHYNEASFAAGAFGAGADYMKMFWNRSLIGWSQLQKNTTIAVGSTW